jgi:hypothetical protein
VLQVLDKHSSPTFSLRDMELLAVFASQATVAIAAARVQRDTRGLLRDVLAELAPDLDEPGVEALVSAATSGLDSDEQQPFWRLVDQVDRLRGLTDREAAMVADILSVVAEHAERTRLDRRGR